MRLVPILERYGVDYPNISDGGYAFGRWGVTGFPETFFIDRQGCVVPPHIDGPGARDRIRRRQSGSRPRREAPRSGRVLSLALAAPAARVRRSTRARGDLETLLVCPSCHTTLDESDSGRARR